MNAITETICIKRWQAFVLLGASGYAVGSILAKITTLLGF